MVENKFLNKCTEKILLKLLKKVNMNDKDITLEDIMNSENSLNDEEIDFITKNEEELN